MLINIDINIILFATKERYKFGGSGGIVFQVGKILTRFVHRFRLGCINQTSYFI